MRGADEHQFAEDADVDHRLRHAGRDDLDIDRILVFPSFGYRTAPGLENGVAGAGRLQGRSQAIQDVEQARSVVLDFAHGRVLTWSSARCRDRATPNVQDVKRIMFHQPSFPARELD